jgi:hypothetical protein
MRRFMLKSYIGKLRYIYVFEVKGLHNVAKFEKHKHCSTLRREITPKNMLKKISYIVFDRPTIWLPSNAKKIYIMHTGFQEC